MLIPQKKTKPPDMIRGESGLPTLLISDHLFLVYHKLMGVGA